MVIEEILQFVWPFIILIFKFFWSWWWLLLIPSLFQKFLYYWGWWRVGNWYGTLYRPILLEIKIPKTIPKSIKAMEAVFTAIHGAICDPPDFWEKYVTGVPQTGLSFDIISIDGRIHFYVRCHGEFRDQVEAAIYSQYPEAEIEVAPDYSKQVPLDIPNREWDLYGWDYQFHKEPQYPIHTYLKFEESGIEEEEKIDPLTSLMEGMAKLKPGEQLWIQLRGWPWYPETGVKDFYKKGKQLRDEIAHRDPEAPKPKSVAHEFLSYAINGVPAEEEEKEQGFLPPEMKLTPGEREVLEEFERKLTKPVFKCTLRTLYLGKRDIFYKPNYRYIYNYFNNFCSPEINSFDVWKKTLTRIDKSPFLWMHPILKRREYVRKRHLLRVYRERDNYQWPWPDKPNHHIIVLNTEEMATLYHFPSAIVAPTPGIYRTEAKETVAPHNLPV